MRLDQLEALYERWGGTPNTDMTRFNQPQAQIVGQQNGQGGISNVTGVNPVFSWCQLIAKGVPFATTELTQPALFLTIREGREQRQAAQKKWITYTLAVLLVTFLPGQTATADRAIGLQLQHWSYADQLGDQIRGTVNDGAAKILTTQAAPNGIFDATTGNASVKFGEQFTFTHDWFRMENYLVMQTLWEIESVEQVNA